MADSVETKISCEKPKVKPEISDTFNWSKEEREKLNEDILVTQLRQKLIEKYPEQKCFFESAVIRIMQLGKNIEEYNEVKEQLGTDIFLLFSADGKLLSYIDNKGNTMFDVSNFNSDEDFSNLLNKNKFNIYIKRNIETGKLELIERGKKYEEGSSNFNTYIYMFYLPTFSYFKRNNK